ncbi:hypothetical protein [Streptomyces sp. NPDC002573]|uniref:hypothetical protein n=1 Tax=Streptomyces sp. NPDC002573 TaxID=3364651 RepID=UPI0036AC7177
MLLPLAHVKTELIEVVRITDPMRHLSAEDLVGDDVAIWGSTQANQVLTLIKDLPGSELHRCFIPGWGIRAHSATDLLFQVARSIGHRMQASPAEGRTRILARCRCEPVPDRQAGEIRLHMSGHRGVEAA